MRTIALKIKESRWTTRLLSPVILVLLIVVFSIITGGRFSNARNLSIVLQQALIVGTVATGAVFIFSTGNVNISMGAATALVATIAANAYLATGSLPVMFTVAVIAGVVVLSLTALLSTVLNIRVLFVTVVMMTLLASIQKAILGSNTLKIPYEVTSALNDANTPLIIFVLFFLFCTALFHFTALGRKLRYIGINEICAELTGFKQSRYLFIAFAIAGIGVGLGAIMTIIRSGSITTDTCATLNMDCMLAIVLGGMSCFGGSRSNTYSGFVGALIVTVLNNGLLMVGVSLGVAVDEVEKALGKDIKFITRSMFSDSTKAAFNSTDSQGSQVIDAIVLNGTYEHLVAVMMLRNAFDGHADAMRDGDHCSRVSGQIPLVVTTAEEYNALSGDDMPFSFVTVDEVVGQCNADATFHSIDELGASLTTENILKKFG